MLGYGLIHSWKSMQTHLRERAGELGCGTIVKGFTCQDVARFNLMYETRIAMDCQINNDSNVWDDYPGNGMQNTKD